MDEFFSKYDEYWASSSSISRWLNNTLEATDSLSTNSTTPHGLRATAATYHAMNGLDSWNLQQFMGWAYAETAEKYVAKSTEQIKVALDQIHND